MLPSASAGADAVAAAWGSNATTAGSLTVNGGLGSATVTVAVNSTAKANSDLINAQTAKTGVTATARTEVNLAFGAVGSYSLNLRSDNGTAQAVSFAVTATGTADGLGAAVAAINDQASKTGVTASLNAAGTAVILTNASGNDITVSDTAVQMLEVAERLRRWFRRERTR